MDIFRSLSRDEPDDYDVDFSKALEQLSAYLHGLGRIEDALRTREEAVVSLRRLVADRPAEYKSDLADSLQVLSRYFRDLKRPGKAIRTSFEGMRILYM